MLAWKEFVTIFASQLSKTVIVAQLVRASDCGSEGRGFETHHSPEAQEGCVSFGTALSFFRTHTLYLYIMTMLRSLIFATALACSAYVSAQTDSTYTLTSGGITRSYILHRPDGLAKDAPVVVVLHGYTGKADPSHYDLNVVADREGFAVCYPQGERDGRGKTCWNVGYPFQADMVIDDIAFLDDLKQEMHRRFGLSRDNQFLTGISNGGEMCYLVAYKRPDLYRAVAPIAGLTLTWMYDELEASAPLPLLEIHGTEDRVSEWTGDLGNEGGWGAYLPVPVAVNYWVAKNHCTHEVLERLPQKGSDNTSADGSTDSEAGPVLLDGRPPIIAHKYAGGRNGSEVWLYEVVGGDHSWLSSYLNTGEVIWEFFSKFVK